MSCIDFAQINRALLPILLILLKRWLPDGKLHGAEWIALNPRRKDHTPGSFSVNVRNGRWADFATGDKGGDVISLAAYLTGVTQSDAARSLVRLAEVGRGQG